MGEMEEEININEQTNKTPTKPKVSFNSVQFQHFHENTKQVGKECRQSLGFASLPSGITASFLSHAAIPSLKPRQLLLQGTKSKQALGICSLPRKSPCCFFSCL